MTVSFFPFKESPSQQPSDASSFKTESEAMRERIHTIDARKAEENSQNEALEAKREASLDGSSSSWMRVSPSAHAAPRSRSSKGVEPIVVATRAADCLDSRV